ncbi:hypothetical protein TNCV_3212971 [Trichonephila clavipes]|nr:hypothetical protein TNCV_3212971 [Trichonephila clavipes]
MKGCVDPRMSNEMKDLNYSQLLPPKWLGMLSEQLCGTGSPLKYLDLENLTEKSSAEVRFSIRTFDLDSNLPELVGRENLSSARVVVLYLRFHSDKYSSSANVVVLCRTW